MGPHRDPFDPDEVGLDLDEVEVSDPLYGMWLEVQTEGSAGRRGFNPAFDEYDPRRTEWEPPPSGAEYYTCTKCKITQRRGHFGQTPAGNRSRICSACKDGRTVVEPLPPLRLRRDLQPFQATTPGRPETSPALTWQRVLKQDLPGLLLLQVDGPLGLLLMEVAGDAESIDPSPMHLEIDDVYDCWFRMTTDVLEGLEAIGIDRAIGTGQFEGIRGITPRGTWFRYLLFARRSAEN